MKSILILFSALLVTLSACKPKDNDPSPAWKETTKLADRYLSRIDNVDMLGVVRHEMEIKAKDKNLVSMSIGEHAYGLFDNITKDKEGEVVGVLNGQYKIKFEYDTKGSIIYKSATHNTTPELIQVSTYNYDVQGRLESIVGPITKISFYYTGNSVDPDSLVSIYHTIEGPTQKAHFTYGIEPSPFNTLPDILYYLDPGAKELAALARHTVTGVKRYMDGELYIDIQYNCIYDADGYLLTKTSNYGDTLKYYYNK